MCVCGGGGGGVVTDNFSKVLACRVTFHIQLNWPPVWEDYIPENLRLTHSLY